MVRSSTRGTGPKVLRLAPWVILVLGPAAREIFVGDRPEAGQVMLTAVLAGFFILLILRLAIEASAQRSRRRPLLVLLVALALWAAGSAMLNSGKYPDLIRFPAPGEWLFLASYIGMASYLILDAGRRRNGVGNSAAWLDTAVICGGAACLAGLAVMIPVARQVNGSGVPLLLSLLYPLIDIVLGVLVLAQLSMGNRVRLRNTAGLLAGFLCFTVADAGFVLHLASGTYDYNLVSVDLWGAGFALLVGNACKMPTNAPPAARREGLTALVVTAGMAAAVVLAVEPAGPVRNYLVGPAILTLGAAGIRLATALRAANRTTEAIRLSRSDDLTGLPNRRALLSTLDSRLASDEQIALAILDLDGFKDINDTLGHAAGDQVLTELGDRMSRELGPDTLLARLGGDEFAILVPHSDELRMVETVVDVLAAIRAPVRVDGITLSVDASAGVTVRDSVDRQSSEMLRRADVAMYDAKRKRAGVLVYDADVDTFSRERLALADQLRRAITERQLHMLYQPQIEASTGRVCGVEALARWQHPTRGVICPAVFLPIARQAGLMQAFSEETARLVISDLQRWRRLGLDPRVALNCAPPELMTGIFATRLTEMLAANDLATHQITIEVTEDSFLAEPERARVLLADLRSLGFELAIDDYGTGFSSLAYLRDLPVQELKIDRSFVADMTTNSRSRMIVASTLQMSNALGLRSVAEGVENAATAAELIALGVSVLQGYHLGRPMPAHDLERYLRQVTAIIP